MAWIVGPLGYLALYVQGAQLYEISPYSNLTYGSSSFWPSVAWLFASFLPLLFAVWGAPIVLRITRGAAAPQTQPKPV